MRRGYAKPDMHNAHGAPKGRRDGFDRLVEASPAVVAATTTQAEDHRDNVGRIGSYELVKVFAFLFAPRRRPDLIPFPGLFGEPNGEGQRHQILTYVGRRQATVCAAQ
jgi:hypothetical protein